MDINEVIDFRDHFEPETDEQRAAVESVANELGEEHHAYSVIRRSGDDEGYYVLAEIFVRDEK